MAEEKDLNSVLKSISKKFGDRVVRVGVEALESDGVLSLGSPTADFCLYGGLPEGRIIEFSGAEGSGKAQPLWSKVFTPAGYVTMGDIKVGDKVIDGKGKVTKVTGVYPRGKLATYRVTFNDRTETYCAGDHLWKVYNHSYGGKPKIEVLTTEDLCKRDLHAGCWGYSIDVPVIDIWEDNNINIDPYLLGALIGDGSLSNTRGVSNSEADVLSKINEKLSKENYTLAKTQNSASCDYSINHVGKRRNQFSDKIGDLFCKLNEYGLLVKSVYKHIPKNYLFSSVETRLELARGLYDTDGYTDAQGHLSFSTSSEQLSIDAAFLFRSLGCRVTISTDSVTYYTDKDNIKQYCGPAWTLYIKAPDGVVLATSEKHTSRFSTSLPATSKWWRSIVNIEYTTDEECQCIMVESDEHTYLTDDLICTHNTSSAFLVAASYQREELKRNPEHPRAIVLLDNEGTADVVWAKKLGYDMSEDALVSTIIIRPEAQSAEEIFDMALDMLKTGEVGLLIFDSIATLVPMQIADESMEKQQMGGIAKALTRFANTAIGLLRKYKATLIAINQVRENMTGYGDPLQTPGGRAWKHACSSRIMFKRGDFFDQDGNILMKKDAQCPAGHIMEMYVLKTKTCKWDRKLGRMHLNYDKGIDIVADTIELATHFGYIDNSVQGSFKLIDVDTGELMHDEQGNEIKIRGKNNLVNYFRDHTAEWRKLYDLCYDKLRQKEDPYIKSFEQMLNININEKLGLSADTNTEEL